MAANPLEQFEIKAILPIRIGTLDLSYTNSALFMTLAVLLSAGFLIYATARRDLVPSRLQSVAELAYEFIAGMIRENAGREGLRYFPFIFSLFMFILLGNLLGLLPFKGAFTFTAHIAINFAIALVLFVAITAIGFARHGTHFVSLFFPAGAPAWTAVFLIPIEAISYLSRPLSLSMRLFANMTVGGVIVKIFAGFVVSLGAFYAIPGLVPLALLVGLIGLKLFIAFLQAYIFTILTCIYLNDAIHLH